MIECKKCGSEEKSKNGIVRGKQRYLCKEYGYTYIKGDIRTNEKTKTKKSLIILLSHDSKNTGSKAIARELLAGLSRSKITCKQNY